MVRDRIEWRRFTQPYRRSFVDSGWKREKKKWSFSIFKMALKQKRSAYDASFKLRVVQYAELTGNNNLAAVREFCVDERQVRDWRKAKETLAYIPKTKKPCRGDKQATHLHLFSFICLVQCSPRFIRGSCIFTLVWN